MILNQKLLFELQRFNLHKFYIFHLALWFPNHVLVITLLIFIHVPIIKLFSLNDNHITTIIYLDSILTFIQLKSLIEWFIHRFMFIIFQYFVSFQFLIITFDFNILNSVSKYCPILIKIYISNFQVIHRVLIQIETFLFSWIIIFRYKLIFLLHLFQP